MVNTRLRKVEDKDSLIGHLGIEFLPVENGVYAATMRVDNRNCQNFGVLNGGAAIALAETLAGYASMQHVDDEHCTCGVQVSASHVGMAYFGSLVTARAKAVRIGATLHVWDVEIRDERDRLISTSRVTNLVIEKRF